MTKVIIFVPGRAKSIIENKKGMVLETKIYSQSESINIAPFFDRWLHEITGPHEEKKLVGV